MDFSAAHRLARADWSEARNQEVFGRAAATTTGHNYVLEVTVQGATDDETGMLEQVLHDLHLRYVEKRDA